MNFEIAHVDYHRTLSYDYAFLYCMFLEIGCKRVWRLPTISELSLIVEENDDTLYWTQLIDSNSFTAKGKVIPVRDITNLSVEFAPVEFEKNLSWNGAVKYCASLNISGKTDWRLPSATEMKEIFLSDNDLDTSRYWLSTDMNILPSAVLCDISTHQAR